MINLFGEIKKECQQRTVYDTFGPTTMWLRKCVLLIVFGSLLVFAIAIWQHVTWGIVVGAFGVIFPMMPFTLMLLRWTR